MVNGRTGHRGALVLPRVKEPELYLGSGTVATPLHYSAGTIVRAQTARTKSAAALANVQVKKILSKQNTVSLLFTDLRMFIVTVIVMQKLLQNQLCIDSCIIASYC